VEKLLAYFVSMGMKPEQAQFLAAEFLRRGTQPPPVSGPIVQHGRLSPTRPREVHPYDAYVKGQRPMYDLTTAADFAGQTSDE
jgi:hypothetical protein